MSLLSARTLERLGRLDVGARQAAGGGDPGERLAGASGSGTLFREHRTYMPGDDLRYVDWNAYGRLRTLQVKVFEREENLDGHVLLDRSLSMGDGPGSKLETARRVAGMVGAVALARGAVVRLQQLPSVERGRPSAHRGRGATSAYLADVEAVGGGGREPLGEALRAAFPRLHRRGAALLVSDFLDPAEGDGGWRRAIDFLRHRRVRLAAVHVVHPDERAPRLSGPLRVVDGETGEEVAVDVDGARLERYRRRFERHLREVAAYLRARGARHVLVEAGISEAQLLRVLLAAGVLR